MCLKDLFCTKDSAMWLVVVGILLIMIVTHD